MLKNEAAAYLAGLTSIEDRDSGQPTNAHIISGEVVSDSEDGLVLVSVDDAMVFGVEGDEDDPDGQYIEIETMGGLEEGDDISILLSGEPGHAMAPMVLGGVGIIDRIVAYHGEFKTLVAEQFEADEATIDDLSAQTAKIENLTAEQLNATVAYIAVLTAGNITAQKIIADDGEITRLSAETAKIENLTAEQLSAAVGYIAALTAGNITAQKLVADDGEITRLSGDLASYKQIVAGNFEAANARIETLDAEKVSTTYLEAEYIDAGTIEANYTKTDMSNAGVAWIDHGVIANGAISSAMINSLSANKLTAGTINGAEINVVNLNASNITAGTINGQRIGEGSLSLSKLEESVYTQNEIDSMFDDIQDKIDGAIETWTGNDVPALNNAPASNWTTDVERNKHVGDVYFIVDSQSQQSGYSYRFTKSNNNTYSWVLIKDSDVTAALQRLTQAEGKITTFDSDISTLKTSTGQLTTRTTSLETRMDDAEDSLLDKVDSTTFNEVSDTVDSHSQTITQHTTAISNKADSSTVTALTNRVSSTEQTVEGITTDIESLSTAVSQKADGSTVTEIQNDYANFKQQVNNFESTVGTTYATKTELGNEIDGLEDSIASISSYKVLDSSYTNTRETIIGWATDLVNARNWTVSSTNGVRVGDLVQIKTVPSDNNSKPLYCLVKVTAVTNSTTLRGISNGYIDSYISQRVTQAETSISQNASEIALKASIGYVDGKTTPSALVSQINVAPSGVKIQASKVEIDGTAIFNEISGDVDSAITSKGYQTSTDVESAITSKGYSTNANTVKRTQNIYYRKSATGAPSKPTSWVSDSGSGTNLFNRWLTRPPRMTTNADGTGTKYLYLYTCVQMEMANGTISCTDVQLDDSATIIDGGQIVTGQIGANFIDVSSIRIGYSQVDNTPSIPSKTSDLSNDSGFQTSSQVNAIANTAKSEAISTAASDATTKANTAKSEAISAAASDATTKANAAANTANYYITEDSTGIQIHKKNNSTTYQHLTGDANTFYVSGKKRSVTDANGLKIYIGDSGSEVQVAAFGTSTRLGKETEGNLALSSGSMVMVDRDLNPIFVVEDKRGNNPYITITDAFTGDGTTKNFRLLHRLYNASTSSVTTVKVNGVTKTSGWTAFYDSDTSNGVTFGTAPAANATIEITYRSDKEHVYYIFGKKDTTVEYGGLSVSEGLGKATAPYSHAEGLDAEASAPYSHAEGYDTRANDTGAHSEGWETNASGNSSHAEGAHTQAIEPYSHAEGNRAIASGYISHAEGYNTRATGDYSHSEGYYTNATGESSHAGGDHSTASAAKSFVHGAYLNSGTTEGAAAFGVYNDYSSNPLFSVGNGTSSANHNALSVDTGGNLTLNDELDIKTGSTDSNLTKPSSVTSWTTGKVKKWGRLVTFEIYYMKLSSALASGSTVSLGTIPAGYRPDTNVYIQCVANATGFQNVYISITSAGAITLNNYSGSSISTSRIISATLTYVI